MSAGSPDSAAQRNGPAALAELRPDEGRHEPRVVERVRHPGLRGLGTKVVAVVEDDRAGSLEREHRPDVGGHRGARAALVLGRLGRPQGQRVGEGHLLRHVPGERVVGGGLVGDEVEPLAGRGPGGLDLRGVADERDRGRVAIAGRRARPVERLRRVVGEQVDVADLEAAPRARLVDLDGEADALVHRHGERLGAAHPAEAGGQGHASRAASRRNAGGPPRRRSRRCPAGCPGSRCRSTSPRSSGRTSSARPARARGSPPRSPTSRRGWSWRSGPVAPIRGSAAPRPACRSGPGASRRRRGPAARGRSHRTRPSCEPPARCRRRRRGGPGPRRPRGRGCSSASAGPLPGPSRGRSARGRAAHGRGGDRLLAWPTGYSVRPATTRSPKRPSPSGRASRR